MGVGRNMIQTDSAVLSWGTF